MKDLITTGKVYIAQPPLYKIKKGKEEFYAYDDDQRDDILKRLKVNGKEKSHEELATEQIEEGSVKGVLISRYKGLGEMNPEQLWETTMNPETRTVLQITLESAAAADKIFETLMGDEVEPIREFIEKNAKYVKNLDI
jgi:DNA gyrase subunit B